MSFIIVRKSLSNFYVLIPFLLVFVGAIFLKIHHPTGSILKISAFVYMIVYVISHQKINKNQLGMTLLFLPLLTYGVLHSFNLMAGIEDGLRYLFPIVSLFYGYSIRKYLDIVVKFIIFFVAINFFIQVINYINWFEGVRQWFYPVTVNGEWYFNQAAGILRASGLVVYFCFFGYMNMIAYFIIKKYYFGKFKKILLGISLAMLLASLSYKTIISFIVVLGFYHYKKILNIFTGLVVLIIGVFMMYPIQMKQFASSLLYRFNSYILMKTPTVRSETYMLMWRDILSFDLFGHGVGAFGGPASLKYNSPYYAEVNFTWPDTFWMKMTTVDTFPPHVFIELGIVGGLLFFLVLIVPLIKKKVNAMILIIYFTLFFDMLFTFSLASLEYMMFSLVLIYPICFYKSYEGKS